MKLHRLLILSGLLVGAAPGVSYAGCATACVLPEVCRIKSQAPTVYGCGLPSDRVVGGARGPSGALTAKHGSSNVMGKGGIPDNATARTTGPSAGPRAPVAHKETIEVASVKSRRERSAATVIDKPKAQP